MFGYGSDYSVELLFCFVFCHSVQEQIGDCWFRVFTRSYLSSLLNIYLWNYLTDYIPLPFVRYIHEQVGSLSRVYYIRTICLKNMVYSISRCITTLIHYFLDILCDYIKHLIPANFPVNVHALSKNIGTI